MLVSSFLQLPEDTNNKNVAINLLIFDCTTLFNMVNRFVPKIILTNGKIVFLSVLFCGLFYYASAQSKAEKAAEKKNEQLQLEKEKAEESKKDAFLNHQLQIQGKKTQKRMKENMQLTDNYYKRKLGKTFFQKLFKKKRRNSHEK